MRLLFLLFVLEFCLAFSASPPIVNPQFTMPSFVMIMDKNNKNLTKIAEKLERFAENSTRIQIEPGACTQLLTLPNATSEQMHLLFRQVFSNISFCEPHVFGPIPDVIEVRIPPISHEEFSANDDDFVTFQLTTKGGVIGFDVELNQPNAASNLLFAITTLMKISRISPGYINGVDNFYRKRHMMPKEEQLAQTRYEKYRKQLEHSYPIEYAMSFCVLVLIIYAGTVSIWLLSGKRAERTAVASTSNTAFSLAQNDFSVETKTYITELTELAEKHQAKSPSQKTRKTQHSDKSESVMNIQSFSLKTMSSVRTCPVKSIRVIDHMPEARTPNVVMMTQETGVSTKE